eukprot:TRINITY_DN395_c0_g1_i5.p1 TRINITY_DN395_c0_g1~~TRINITY_DN395_c0_g1_i5.p1  ORF type:complete len:184 (-),score=37.91 TRINITY_DN395_c0_g1_i5:1502-2053(-)
MKYFRWEKNEWELVASKFNSANPRKIHRDVDLLKQRFKKLHSTKKPTGDPSIPEEVKEAKRIARAIDDRAATVEISEGEDDPDGDNGEEAGDSAEQENTDDELALSDPELREALLNNGSEENNVMLTSSTLTADGNYECSESRPDPLMKPASAPPMPSNLNVLRDSESVIYCHFCIIQKSAQR